MYTEKTAKKTDFCRLNQKKLMLDNSLFYMIYAEIVKNCFLWYKISYFGLMYTVTARFSDFCRPDTDFCTPLFGLLTPVFGLLYTFFNIIITKIIIYKKIRISEKIFFKITYLQLTMIAIIINIEHILENL